MVGDCCTGEGCTGEGCTGEVFPGTSKMPPSSGLGSGLTAAVLTSGDGLGIATGRGLGLSGGGTGAPTCELPNALQVRMQPEHMYKDKALTV
jgi:hypothetical protein